MNVIDVAQRAASRDRAPMISFRRTDADRRPARRVAMPNDGPAPDRHARSEAVRAKLLRRQPAAPQIVDRAPLPEVFERNLNRCLVAISGGKELLVEIAPAIGLGVDRTRDFCKAAAKRGLVEKVLVRRGNCTFAHFSLTDAGRAQLQGGADDQR